MIECSPDPHFTQTQNTNQESLVKSNSQLSEGFLWILFGCGCWYFLFFFIFILRSFLGLQLKLQFL